MKSDAEFDSMTVDGIIETPQYVTDFYNSLLTELNTTYNLQMKPYPIIIKARKLRRKLAHIDWRNHEIVIYGGFDHWKGSLIHETIHQLFKAMGFMNPGTREEVHSSRFWLCDEYYCNKANTNNGIPRAHRIAADIVSNIPNNAAITTEELKALLPQYDHDTIMSYINSRFIRHYISVKWDNDEAHTAYFKRTKEMNDLGICLL